MPRFRLFLHNPSSAARSAGRFVQQQYFLHAILSELGGVSSGKRWIVVHSKEADRFAVCGLEKNLGDADWAKHHRGRFAESENQA